MGSDMCNPFFIEACLRDRIEKLEKENEELRAKLERYEAPGPPLLRVLHADWCEAVEPIDNGDCNCNADRSPLNDAYREQHARDVAIVRAVETSASWEDLPGARACLSALEAGNP